MDAKEYLKSKHPSAVNPLDYLPINVMTVVGLMESYHQSKLAEMPSDIEFLNKFFIAVNDKYPDIIRDIMDDIKQQLKQ